MLLRFAGVVSITAVTSLVSTNAAPALSDACPTYNPPNALGLVGGTPQSAKLLTPFANPLEVAVINTNGCPITTPTAGIAVLFAAPGNGPSGTFSCQRLERRAGRHERIRFGRRVAVHGQRVRRRLPGRRLVGLRLGQLRS